MTVGQRIRVERKKKGLTQKQLGELCGIAEPTIRRYELGLLNPKYATLKKIANGLGIRVQVLNEDETVQSPPDEQKKTIDAQIRYQELFTSPNYYASFVSQNSWLIDLLSSLNISISFEDFRSDLAQINAMWIKYKDNSISPFDVSDLELLKAYTLKAVVQYLNERFVLSIPEPDEN